MSVNEGTRHWLEQLRKTWDARASQFDEMSAANAKSHDRAVELDFVVRALDLRPGSAVLDAGCGTGHFGIALAQRGCIVDGIDLSPEMIGRARINSDRAGVNISFSVGDLVPLEAPDRAYDAIVARMVLQFSPHLSAALDELERVLAPDGRLWVAVPGALSPIYRHSWKRFLASETEPLNYVTPWELNRILQEKGWRIGQQWGSFDSLGEYAGNVARALDVSELPLPLQQAAATVWNVIATRLDS
jgi:ubiquinone/menaquinone biosynthesis C-methylase UbiE